MSCNNIMIKPLKNKLNLETITMIFSYICTMKNSPSKGDRLKWVPLTDLKPSRLNKNLTKGKPLTKRELDKRKGPSTTKTLVP